MGTHEPWPEKFRRLIRRAADEIGVERPRLVTPRRDSGPRMFPKNWHTVEGQRTVNSHCRECLHGECADCPHWQRPEPPKAA